MTDLLPGKMVISRYAGLTGHCNGTKAGSQSEPKSAFFIFAF
jgi:hypothetical protein